MENGDCCYLNSQRWQGGVGFLIRAFGLLLVLSSTLIELRLGASLCAHLHSSATTTRKKKKSP